MVRNRHLSHIFQRLIIFFQRKIWQAADLFVITLSHKNSNLKRLQWDSSNPSVATADQDGLLRQ